MKVKIFTACDNHVYLNDVQHDYFHNQFESFFYQLNIDSFEQINKTKADDNQNSKHFENYVCI